MIPSPPPNRPRRVRAPWGFLDLVLVGIVGVVLGAVLAVAATGATFVGATLAGIEVSLSLVFAAISSALYAGFALAVWLMVVERRSVRWRGLGLRRTRVGLLLAMVPAGFGLLIVNVLLLLPLTFFLDLGDPGDAAGRDRVYGGGGGLEPIEVLALAVPLVVLAPVVEELLFRGLLYRWLRGRVGVVLAVAFSALVFGVLHVVAPPLVVMGVVLAIVAERTGSIVPGIVLHATNNALVLIALWLASGSG